jgi:hypothetical protein
MRKTPFLWCLVLGGLIFQPALGAPQDRRQQREERREERRMERPESRFGPSEAARMAQSRNGGGRVLNVNPTDEGYRVKLLKQGEVRVILVPNQP